MADYQKNKVLEEVEDILDSLEDDYDVYVDVSITDIQRLVDTFYDYYVKKRIVYDFVDNMIRHFHDIAIEILESMGEEFVFDWDYLLKRFQFYELLESCIEVDPNDTKKMIYALGKDK